VNKIRKRLTYANLMSSIAVFLVLGGATAFAAAQLGKNTVGTKQLKKNAVTGVKVKDGSLTAADFKPGQLPAGAAGKEGKQGQQGKQGPEGKQGQIGPSDLYSAVGPFRTLNTGETKVSVASVTLPPGSYQVIASQTAQPSGGGAELDCYIYAGASQEASFYAKLAANTDGNVTGMAALVLTETTVVADQCTAFEHNVIVPEPKLLALKVGTIH
jgi:hypothetical protein